MNPMDLHESIAHLHPLLGTWRGTGNGSYPTIEPFSYVEEVTFGHVGKPFIAYTQKTRHAETNLPLHAEAGYLRPVGVDMIELVLAQPSGIVEVHNGTVVRSENRLVIDVTASLVATTATAKDASEVRRTITIEPSGDDGEPHQLNYVVAMAAVGHELQHHLAASLRLITED